MSVQAHDLGGAFRDHLYPPGWRWIAAALFAFSRASLPACLALVIVADDPPVTPPVLAELLVLFALLPGTAAYLIRRAFAADVRIVDGVLLAQRRSFRLEVPCASIGRVAPCALPLPAAGFRLRMRSRRRLPYVIATPDPAPLLQTLTEAGQVEGAREALHHPTVVYAHARAGSSRGCWSHPLVKFGLFSLPWGAIFFNVDQHITYGGTLGQYYLQGLGPYLRSFAFYWAGTAMQMLLYASVWRGLAEALALVAAGVAPSLAAKVRRAAEIACLAIFYAGIPLLVLLRFLP